jgi:hypothetical protein
MPCRNVGVEPTGRTETLVRDYHYPLRNNPEERNFQANKA